MESQIQNAGGFSYLINFIIFSHTLVFSSSGVNDLKNDMIRMLEMRYFSVIFLYYSYPFISDYFQLTTPTLPCVQILLVNKNKF